MTSRIQQKNAAFAKSYGASPAKIAEILNPKGQRWAWLSLKMFDQIAFEESQKRELPFTMAQPTKFYEWITVPIMEQGPEKTPRRTGRVRQDRVCRGCNVKFTEAQFKPPTSWLDHEDTCPGLESLAVRTIERLIEMNDRTVPEIVTRYPNEMNRAAQNLLARMK